MTPHYHMVSSSSNGYLGDAESDCLVVVSRVQGTFSIYDDSGRFCKHFPEIKPFP